MYKDEEIKEINSVLNGKVWNQYIEPYLKNQKETLTKNVSIKEDRDYTAGRLGEIINILNWVNQLREDYKDLQKGKK